MEPTAEDPMSLLLKLVMSGGPYALAGIMAFLYWLERMERKEVQKKLDDLLEKSLVTFMSVQNTLNDVKDAIKELKSIVMGRPA